MGEDEAVSEVVYDGNTIEKFDISGFEKLLKALTTRPPKARVGIIGGKVARTGSGPTNADIGAVHEFGSANTPMRSFLRIPISKHLMQELERAGLLDVKALKEVLKSGSVKPWLEKVAISAEACVADAFDTSGDGSWPAWSNPNYSNNTGQLLVDTQQLRNSITSEVKD